MTTYVAKPYLNRNKDMKEFSDIREAVSYLERITGIQMSFEINKKTKEKTYDWELIGKLTRKES